MAVERWQARTRDRAACLPDGLEAAPARRGVHAARNILGLQRARLISAAVGVLAEDGYAGFTAAGVCERAGVSRRTYYEIFENREQCLSAVLVEAEQRAGAMIAGLGLETLSWSERIRMGLWALLCLADSDPKLAKVCLVESQHAGAQIQRQRERILRRLVAALDEGRKQRSGSSAPSRLTAEALVGAVTSVLAARLARSTQAPGEDGEGAPAGVRALLGELTGMIVLPYQGPAAARRQIERALPETPAAMLSETVRSAAGPDPLARLPMRLTYRTARVLQAVAKLTRAGLGASNRAVADEAGISDAGQISKLLGRLQENDLLENAAIGNHERGEANQWQLTPTGRSVLHSISPEAERARRRSAA